MKTFSLPERNYNVGTTNSALPQTTGRKYVGAKVSLTRVNWPAGVNYDLPGGGIIPNTVAVVTVESSLDGVNWALISRATLPGGVIIGRDGNPVPVSEFETRWGVIEKDGDVRVVFERLVSFRTAITATVFELSDL
jgi:hypothetical protein